MTENEGKRDKMEKLKKGKSMIVFTGTAAVLAIAVNLVITAVKHHKDKNSKKKGTIPLFSSISSSICIHAAIVQSVSNKLNRFTEIFGGNL